MVISLTYARFSARFGPVGLSRIVIFRLCMAYRV
jgi:hypothetical protein